MIGSQNIGVNGCRGDFLRQTVGNQEIVDAPASVVLPGVKAVAPPAVDTGGIGILETEGVCKARFQKLAEAIPFLVREAGIAPVAGRIFQIDLLVCHIQVSADNDGF